MAKGFSLSRRGFMAGSAASGAVLGAGFGPAVAKAPMIGTPAPYFYRFKLGDA